MSSLGPKASAMSLYPSFMTLCFPPRGGRNGSAAAPADQAEGQRGRAAGHRGQGAVVLRGPHLPAPRLGGRVEDAVRAVVLAVLAVGGVPQVARRLRVVRLLGLLRVESGPGQVAVEHAR